MSEDWNTKYGTRRVRRDPPTLEEAIFAAVGITDDQQQQAEIAAALMGLPYEEVLAEVKKTGRAVARSATRIIAGEQGAQRAVAEHELRAELVGERPHRLVLRTGGDPQALVALGTRHRDQLAKENAADTPPTHRRFDAERDLGERVR